MPIAGQCPKCSKTVKAPDDFVGKQVKCLKCQTTFMLTSAGRITEEPPAPPKAKPAAEQPADRPVGGPAVRIAFWMGAAALLLGVVAVVLGVIPRTARFSQPVAWGGIALGAAAVVLAIVREECGFVFPYAGAATSLLSLGILLFWLETAVRPQDNRGPRGGPPGATGPGGPPGRRGGPPDGKGGPPGGRPRDDRPPPGQPK